MLGPLRALGRFAPRTVEQASTSRLLAGFLLALRAAGRRPDTLSTYEKRVGRLIRFLGDPPARAISTEDLRRWLIRLKEGTRRETSDIYVEGHRAGAATFFDWCVAERHLEAAPSANLARYKCDEPELRMVTPEQVERLIAMQPATTSEGARNRALMAVLFDTGLRVRSLVGLDLEDVDIAGGTLRIRTKSRRVKRVPILPVTAKLIWTYVERARPRTLFAGTGRLFLARGGDPLTTNAVRLMLGRAALRAGMDGSASPHAWRHGFGTFYTLAGGDQFSLMAILDHKTTQMTSRYVHVAEELGPLAARHATASPMARVRV